MARAIAHELGLEVVEATVDTSADYQCGVLQNVAQSFIGRVDFIYVPTDNTVVSCFFFRGESCRRDRISGLSWRGKLGPQGALATVGWRVLSPRLGTLEMALCVF